MWAKGSSAEPVLKMMLQQISCYLHKKVQKCKQEKLVKKYRRRKSCLSPACAQNNSTKISLIHLNPSNFYALVSRHKYLVNGILTRHVLRNIFYKSPNLSTGSAMLDINMLFVLALMSKQGECMFGGGLHFAIEIVELIQR